MNHLRNRRQRVDVLLQALDGPVVRARQQLHQIAPRRFHGQVRVHEHAQPTNRWNLLAHSIIARDVLRDLARNQRDLPDIRLFQPNILDDAQKAVLSNRAANIQLAAAVQRQLDHGVFRIAADVAGRIRHGNQAAGWTAAVYAQRHRIVSAFEHCAHHRRSRHQTAQPGGDDRRGLMNLLGRARNVRSVQSTAHHRSVPRNTAHEFSHS